MKKIIGYKCPMDLFNGTIKKGTLYVKEVTNYVSTDGSRHLLPAEIVETWEPLCMQEFKVGDWVVWKNDATNTPYKLKEVSFDSFQVSVFDDSQLFFSRYTVPVQEVCRKATHDEIKQHLIRMAKEKGLWEVPIYHAASEKIPFNDIYTVLYCGKYDRLYSTYGSVYENGKWAKPIKPTKSNDMKTFKVLTGTAEEVEDKLNELAEHYTPIIKGVSATDNLTTVVVKLTKP